MSNDVLGLDQISKAVIPIAEKYKLRSVYVFGSYARQTADENSDIDILIDREGSDVQELYGYTELYNELKEALNKNIDLVTLQSLQQKSTQKLSSRFVENVMKERVSIYGSADEK